MDAQNPVICHCVIPAGTVSNIHNTVRPFPCLSAVTTFSNCCADIQDAIKAIKSAGDKMSVLERAHSLTLPLPQQLT